MKKRQKRNLIKLLIITVILGFAGGYMKLLYEDKFGSVPFLVYVAIIAVVVLILYVIVNASSIKIKKKMQKAIDKLSNEHDEKGYLAEMLELQKKKRGFFDLQYDANMIFIDINVVQGSFLNGKYDKVIKLIKKMNFDFVHPYAKATSYSYYLLSLYKLKKVDVANSVMEEKYDLLKQYVDVNNLGTFINMVFAYEAFYNENVGQCEEYLDKANKLASGYYEKKEYNRVMNVLIGQK